MKRLIPILIASATILGACWLPEASEVTAVQKNTFQLFTIPYSSGDRWPACLTHPDGSKTPKNCIPTENGVAGKTPTFVFSTTTAYASIGQEYAVHGDEASGYNADFLVPSSKVMHNRAHLDVNNYGKIIFTDDGHQYAGCTLVLGNFSCDTAIVGWGMPTANFNVWGNRYLVLQNPENYPAATRQTCHDYASRVWGQHPTTNIQANLTQWCAPAWSV